MSFARMMSVILELHPGQIGVAYALPSPVFDGTTLESYTVVVSQYDSGESSYGYSLDIKFNGDHMTALGIRGVHYGGLVSLGAVVYLIMAYLDTVVYSNREDGSLYIRERVHVDRAGVIREARRALLIDRL